MDFTLTELSSSFFISVVVGFALGSVYEIVRIFHFCGYTKYHHYFISDILFIVFSTLITYFYSIAMLEGKVRFFVIIGEFFGFFIYCKFIAPITKKIFIPLIKIFKKILLNLLKLCRQIMYNVSVGVNLLKSKFVVFIDKVRLNGKNRKEKKSLKRIKRSKTSKEKI